MSTDREHLLEWARKRSVFRASEAAEIGIHSQTLTRLVEQGEIERVSAGLYRVPGADITAHHGLVLATEAAPGAVVCLLSALAYHEVGTQLPHTIWMALERSRRSPRVKYPPVQFVTFSGRAFAEGIETHEIEGQRVRVYCIPKTIADCFKFRNRIGLDVAIEALRDAWQSRRVRISELEHYAAICRVQRVMHPYLEAIAG